MVRFIHLKQDLYLNFYQCCPRLSYIFSTMQGELVPVYFSTHHVAECVVKRVLLYDKKHQLSIDEALIIFSQLDHKGRSLNPLTLEMEHDQN